MTFQKIDGQWHDVDESTRCGYLFAGTLMRADQLSPGTARCQKVNSHLDNHRHGEMEEIDHRWHYPIRTPFERWDANHLTDPTG